MIESFNLSMSNSLSCISLTITIRRQGVVRINDRAISARLLIIICHLRTYIIDLTEIPTRYGALDHDVYHLIMFLKGFQLPFILIFGLVELLNSFVPVKHIIY